MVKEMSLKMRRFGWYPKLTLSKVIEPPSRIRSPAPTLSCGRFQRQFMSLERIYSYLWRLVLGLDVKKDLHVQQALPQLPVHCPQEVEWQRKLEHKLVDHYKIAHSHGSYKSRNQYITSSRMVGVTFTIQDTLSGKEHHQCQRRRKNNVLSGIQESERCGNLDRRFLV